jgi:hypothetical protein
MTQSNWLRMLGYLKQARGASGIQFDSGIVGIHAAIQSQRWQQWRCRAGAGGQVRLRAACQGLQRDRRGVLFQS